MLTGNFRRNIQTEHQLLTGKLTTQTEHQLLTSKLKLNTRWAPNVDKWTQTDHK